MFGTSFLVVGCILLFLAIVFFVMADKSEIVESGQLPTLIDWSFLLAVFAIFCLLSEYLNFTTVFLIMAILTGIAFFTYHFSKRKTTKEEVETLSVWHLVEYLKGFFWIFVVFFIIRSFIFDLSIIPSSSMRPGLVVGDFVLVNKFHYGIKMPISNQIIIENKPVKRGEVIIFNYPVDRSIQFVKRVIGVPGDSVEYKDKQLKINDQIIAKDFLTHTSYLENSYNVAQPFMIELDEYQQKIDETQFNIYEEPNLDTLNINRVTNKDDNCQYQVNGFTCKIPLGKYLVLGDNRDNSEDGRYWGFVDEIDIQGKAYLVWMNFKDFSRIGTFVK